MMLDDIKADETCVKIKRRAMDREFGETGCLEPAFKQNTNDDDDHTMRFRLSYSFHLIERKYKIT